MNIIAALLSALVVYGAFRLAQDYVRRSMRSFASAERVRADMIEAARSLLLQDVPEPVARAIIGVVSITGCGCFVRGMLFSHYLPGAYRVSSINEESEATFAAIENLDADKRELFGKLLIMVIVFDGFRNPLQGWIFRRVLRSSIDNKITVTERMEASLTAFSVLSRRPVPAV